MGTRVYRWPGDVLSGPGYFLPHDTVWPTVYPLGCTLSWAKLIPGVIGAGVNLACYTWLGKGTRKTLANRFLGPLPNSASMT